MGSIRSAESIGSAGSIGSPGSIGSIRLAGSIGSVGSSGLAGSTGSVDRQKAIIGFPLQAISKASHLDIIKPHIKTEKADISIVEEGPLFQEEG